MATTETLNMHLKLDEKPFARRERKSSEGKDSHRGQKRPLRHINGHCKKRKYSHSSDSKLANKRKRNKHRFIIPPTKFLLGGNYHDPLNLKIFEDEEINRQMNEVTPYSSPLPPSSKNVVQIIHPENIHDPLNLAKASEGYPKKKRKKNRKKSKSENNNNNDINANEKSFEESTEEKTASDLDLTASTEAASLICNESHSTACSLDYSNLNKNPKKDANQPKILPTFSKYQFGGHNVQRIYSTDPRFKFLQKEWFENMEVLDVGCGQGGITLHIAQNYNPKSIVGLDIDSDMINRANKNLAKFLSDSKARQRNYPKSFSKSYGNLLKTFLSQPSSEDTKFPNNIKFIQGDYIPKTDEEIEMLTPKYDTIILFQICKWVNLNWGEAALASIYKKACQQLRPGGVIILEQYNEKSYAKSRKLSEKTRAMFDTLRFCLGDDLSNYFNQQQPMGLSKSSIVGAYHHPTKRYSRKLIFLTKGPWEHDYWEDAHETEEDKEREEYYFEEYYLNSDNDTWHYGAHEVDDYLGLTHVESPAKMMLEEVPEQNGWTRLSNNPVEHSDEEAIG